MNRNSKEFLALQRKWYKKAEKSGFEDIEQPDENLKIWSYRFVKACENDPTLHQSKEEYYRLAGSFLHEHLFKDQKSRLIWQMHSEGVSIRNIVKALKSRRFKTYRREVHQIIQDLAALMLKKADSNE